MIVHVALPLPITKTFSYGAPDEWRPYIQKYRRVTVPFHNKSLVGFITGLEEGANPGLRDVIEINDLFPLVTPRLAGLVEWASRYYVTPLGVVLKYVLPRTLHVERYLYIRSRAPSSALLEGMSLTKALKAAGKKVLMQHLIEGSVTLYDLFTGNAFPGDDSGSARNEAPRRTLCIGDVENRVRRYIELIAAHVEQGNNVLMLLPDYYASGAYFSKVLRQRFRERVLWYGSSITAKKRADAWFRANNGKGYLLLGNKSSVFLPVNVLSCIIVERDEEDEYRNEEGFKFNTPTVAIQRAGIEGADLFIGSASPSIETYNHALENGFTVINDAWLEKTPARSRIHTRDARAYGTLLEEMVEAARETLGQGQNIAIFTPRKDYGSYVQCTECKKPFQCPRCEGILNFQKETGKLTCSNCTKSFIFEEHCTECGGSVIRFGQVGAEYIEERLRNAIPQYPVIRIVGETGKDAGMPVLPPAGQPCVIVGTQPLSKMYGTHVHRLILYGWEDIRRMAGYRADEKMFHIMANLIDALAPDEIHFFMETRKKVGPADFFDMDTFYAQEIRKRRSAQFPPSCRIFLIEVVKKTEEAGTPVIRKIKERLAHHGLADHVTGPFMQRRNGFRWKMILRGDDDPFYNVLLEIYDLPDVRIEADPPNI